MLLAVLALALCFTLAFLPLHLSFPLAAVGAAPLLALAYQSPYSFQGAGKTKVYLPWVYLGLLGWNIGATWWIWNSTAGGAIAAIVINSALQLLPWALFRRVQRMAHKQPLWALPVWVAGQVAFELGHMHWDLSWSWLNLGNALAFQHYLAQWYSLAGTITGSLWLWSLNALAAMWLISKQHDKKLAEGKQLNLASHWPGNKLLLQVLMVVAGLPVLISLVLYFSWGQPSSKPVEVLVLQPNVDPYTEKFAGGVEGARDQLVSMVRKSDSLIGPDTKFVLWPETSIPYPIMPDADNPDADGALLFIQSWLQKHPDVTLVAGINSYRMVNKAERERDPGVEAKYITYNTAIACSFGKPTQLYQKSKLVPGVEQLPYPELFEFLGPLAIDLGGTVGSLGKQEQRIAFAQRNDSALRVAPIICYESIYGGFVADFVKQGGANFLGIITNDAWWGRTPGHVQHWNFARLRAIENRQYIARSANTGISGFMNSRGDVLDHTSYNEPAVRKGLVYLNADITTYTQHHAAIEKALALLLPFCLVVGLWFGRR